MPSQGTPTDGPHEGAPLAAAPAPAPSPAAPAPAPSPAPASASAAMPAPAASIPNLLARIRPGGTGARGSRRGGRARMPPIPPENPYPYPHPLSAWSRSMPPPSHPLTGSQRITTIQGTDTDAALSRLSAVGIGLLDDQFAQYFAGDGGAPAPRRLPIINRGTFTRTMALDNMIEAFLAHGDGPQQVVSLGAGTDTRALRLLTRQGQQQKYSNVVYHEIDFSRVSGRKRAIVEAVPAIRTLLHGPVTEHSATSWSVKLGDGDNVLYSHGIDLREFHTGFDGMLPGYQSSLPTLVVSECCLCYLQPDEARSVLKYFAQQQQQQQQQQQKTPALGVVIYEPIHPNDSFGRTMVTNLAARGIEMPTLAAWPDGPSQDARLVEQLGTDAHADHRTIEQIWDKWVSEDEKARVNALEGLDEEEEWKLLASHYVVAWGWRGGFFESVWDHLDASFEEEE